MDHGTGDLQVVIRLSSSLFSMGRPTGYPLDVLTGFLNDEGDAQGRPVGVAIDKQGALLVADDVGNIVWRITEKKQ